MLRKLNNSAHGQKGYSVATWAAVFAAVIAASLLIRVPVKRGLQGKIISVTDYMFWTKWGAGPQQDKEDNTFTKTETSQSIDTTRSEKDKYIKYTADSGVSEKTISTSVEDGTQPVLRTFNLNDTSSVTPGKPIIVGAANNGTGEIDKCLALTLKRPGEICYNDGIGNCKCYPTGHKHK